MKIVLLLSLVFAVSLSSSAFAGGYLSLTGSKVNVSDTSDVTTSLQNSTNAYDGGWGVGAAVGSFGGSPTEFGARFETELNYLQAPAKKSSDMWVFDWTVNGWYDLRNSTGINPYLGGGIGIAKGKTASNGMVDNSGNGYILMYGAGVDITVTKTLSLDFGYRHNRVGEFSSNGYTSFNPSWSAFTGGLRINY